MKVVGGNPHLISRSLLTVHWRVRMGQGLNGSGSGDSEAWQLCLPLLPPLIPSPGCLIPGLQAYCCTGSRSAGLHS